MKQKKIFIASRNYNTLKSSLYNEHRKSNLEKRSDRDV